jgi:hypothetical protein
MPEVKIFEVAEHSQVEDHRQGDEHLPLAGRLDSVDGQAAAVIHQGRDHQEREEFWLPAGIEVIAGRQQQQRLGLMKPGERPVEREEDGEEVGELKRIEQHASPSSLRERSAPVRRLDSLVSA